MAYSRKAGRGTGKRSANARSRRVRSKPISRKTRGKRVGQRSRGKSSQTVRLVIEQAPVAAPVMSAQDMLTPTQTQAARVRRF